jgi:hypothetical protein
MKDRLGRYVRLFLIFSLLLSMTGCFYWWRAYQTYQQMDEFDQHFAIHADEDFVVDFKDPILYSNDFIQLAKLRPSREIKTANGKVFRYIFRKIDAQGRIVKPEVSFYFDLIFNQDDKISRWIFSPLFLQIAPAEFLELSFRSLGGADINTEAKQLKVDTSKVKKIDAPLPLKQAIVAHLGEPLSIKDKGDKEVYLYHFQLEAHDIEEGYEERALSELKLTFDKKTQEMIKMAGRFAGLKISINYRKYQKQRKV